MQAIRSKNRIFIHGAAATPIVLIKELAKKGIEDKLNDIKLYHIHTHGFLPVGAEYDGIFSDFSLFMGKNVRKAVNAGKADFIPVFLSQIPKLFTDNVIDLDAALIQVSPPDKHGFCSLGTSVDCTRAAIKNAKIIIAQINSFMPRTHGDGQVHVSHIDFAVEHNEKLFGWDDEPVEPNEIQKKIGERVADLIENDSAIQLGIGAIPNAVCASLANHKNLGIHSEMFMDGVVDWVYNGVVNISGNNVQNVKPIFSFAVGKKNLYRFLD
ncbi:hypothetical protein MHBO_000241 [Bonamia ostreae]|uniref:Acetyl-CoA hydrolase/transferase N-terminal domain-containing protein n=1 Tax=Bonamia ostreae TaxID=126728 RepID=A0ABV2AEY2_9EUKA